MYEFRPLCSHFIALAVQTGNSVMGLSLDLCSLLNRRQRHVARQLRLQTYWPRSSTVYKIQQPSLTIRQSLNSSCVARPRRNLAPSDTDRVQLGYRTRGGAVSHRQNRK